MKLQQKILTALAIVIWLTSEGLAEQWILDDIYLNTKMVNISQLTRSACAQQQSEQTNCTLRKTNWCAAIRN